jgi:hypothetical protein|tara:strand:- start:1138 stop:1323 length:186 start_codon:yes stop_codon:yes gene_type:complete
MNKEITTEWTLEEVSTIRLAMIDRIRLEKSYGDSACPDRLKRLEVALTTIKLLHEDMIFDN